MDRQILKYVHLANQASRNNCHVLHVSEPQDSSCSQSFVRQLFNAYHVKTYIHSTHASQKMDRSEAVPSLYRPHPVYGNVSVESKRFGLDSLFEASPADLLEAFRAWKQMRKKNDETLCSKPESAGLDTTSHINH
jgi:hypothetical protein